MIRSSMKAIPLSCYIIYFSFVLVAILSFVFRTYFFYGISIAPLFLMILMALYGLVIGGVGALVVYSIAILMGEIWLPFAILHMVAILFIGWRLRKSPQGLISHNFLYWIMIGIPLILFYYIIVFGNVDDIIIALIQREFSSTIVFSLLADIILAYGPLNMYARAKLQFPKGYFFNRMMVHTSLMALLIPFLVYIIVNGQEGEKRILNSIDEAMISQMQSVENYLNKLASNELFLLKQRGLIQSRKSNQELELIAKNTHYEIFIVDQDRSILTAYTKDPYQVGQLFDWHAGGTVISEYEGYSYWLPNVKFHNELFDWNHGYVIQEAELQSVGLTVIIITPFSPYLISLLHIYQPQIWVLFLVCATILLLNFIYNRVFFSLLTKLAQSTIGIPGKLIDGKELSWPKNGIIEVDALVDNFRTVTDDLKETFNRTHHLAYYDSLTGLANRLRMQEDLVNIFAQSTNYGSIAVLFFDLDRFKSINDSLGHSVGDQLLQQIANRLAMVCNEHYHLYRVSGDEFVIIVEQTNLEQAQLVAQQILEVLSQPLFIEQNELNITASIGIALYPEHGDHAEAVLKGADSAMYVAKENGGNTYSTYVEYLNTRVSERLWIENQLRKALDDQQFSLNYQVIMNTETSMVTGIEALLRWNHPVRGNIPPSQFIPIAEQTGMIIPIGNWVLYEACRQNKQWQIDGFDKVRIAVNLSARQLYSDHLVQEVQQVLVHTGLEPQYLELEVTEGYIIKDPEYVNHILQELHAMGVTVSIDDFGTGYSSLSQLRRFPVQVVKIDQDFIRNIEHDRNNRSIVGAVIELAHGMDLKVVAEGIETDAERNFLLNHQCDEIQGYLLGKPMPAEKFEDQLRELKFYQPNNGMERVE